MDLPEHLRIFANYRINRTQWEARGDQSCLSDVLCRAADEIERLQKAEGELYDKCGELQRRVWKLEAARDAGGRRG
jgi:hypothetical protein